MKQILQDLKNGTTYLEDVPKPSAKNKHLIIQNRCSLISVGTEKMLMNFGKANLLEKARQQPDKVKMVLNKVKTDGLVQTLDAVKTKLNQPLPLGYSAAGVVVDPTNTPFKEGDRVISNGHHAQIVRVPQNLVAKIPDNVSDQEASFTVVTAIALQGIRLLKPTLGECIVVTGLGLIGLIAVQLLKANGCRVLGLDFDKAKVEKARSFGVEAICVSPGMNVVEQAMQFSRGKGVDGVLITASTQSNEPVSQAAKMSRKRGRIILVGVIGLELSRADFYEKELTFQVSCSYGPGRYDKEYEDKGVDYPAGFVRWTQQRNFEAALDMMSSGQLDVKSLISHQFEFEKAEDAYARLNEPDTLGVVLNYDEEQEFSSKAQQTIGLNTTVSADSSKVSLGVIGAGNYAGRVLIPAFRKTNVRLDTLVSSGGLSSTHWGRQFGFKNASTDAEALFNSGDCNTIVIATQHHQHADQVIKGLESGKHVFVEKPLAINSEQLDKIDSSYKTLIEQNKAPLLMVGFNRRFSPQVQKMKQLLDNNTIPKSFIMTVNAGAIPADHWTQDPAVGGGRVIGEACHFIDLLRFLSGHKITSVQQQRMGTSSDNLNDNVTITLTFEDGSLGNIHYLANGHSSFPKERLEVFCDGGILQLDNFRKMRGFGWPGFSKMNLLSQDKGQNICASKFVKAIETGSTSPIPYDELMEVARVTIDVADRLAN